MRVYFDADCGHGASTGSPRLVAQAQARGEKVICNRCAAIADRTPEERSASATKAAATRRYNKAMAEWEESAPPENRFGDRASADGRYLNADHWLHDHRDELLMPRPRPQDFGAPERPAR